MKVVCSSEFIGDRILRVTTLDEVLYISTNDCALLVDTDTIPASVDYGAYLIRKDSFDEQSIIQGLSGKLWCLLPETVNLYPGQFILLQSDGLVCMLTQCATNDVPDRTLFLTGRCNSNCIMCPYTLKWRSNAQDSDEEVISQFINLMNPNSQYLCITGGEPTLLGNAFFNILKMVKYRFDSCLTHILTNGRAFYYSDFVERFLTVRPSNTMLGVPLYGHNSSVHDAITQTVGSFEETIQGLHQLYRQNETIELRIVVSALNAPYLLKIADFIIENFRNVYMVSFMGLELMGNAYINFDAVWIDFDDLLIPLSNAVDRLVLHGVQTQLYNFPLCKISRKHWALCKKSITPEKIKFSPLCEPCVEKGNCGGFFQTTLRVANTFVTPFMEKHV